MKSDLRYIIKRIIVGVAIALILMLIKGNVFAAPSSVLINYTNIYNYEKDSNTNTNVTSNITSVTSGGAVQWWRFPKARYRSRLTFSPELTQAGYYDIQFSTYNEDRAVFNAFITVGTNNYSCESYYDLSISYFQSSSSGSTQEDMSSGSQSFICHNVYLYTTSNPSLFLNANVGASTNHYVYITKYFVFDPVSDVASAIQSQTQQQHQDSQNTQNAINDVNNSLTDSTSPSGSDTNNAYSSFDSSTAQNGVITSLITLPIQLFTNINNSVNASCTRFDMGTLLGTRIYFNCIQPSRYLGTQLWNIIDILMSGFLVWYIAKKFIKVFENLSSLKEGDPVGD